MKVKNDRLLSEKIRGADGGWRSAVLTLLGCDRVVFMFYVDHLTLSAQTQSMPYIVLSHFRPTINDNTRKTFDLKALRVF